MDEKKLDHIWEFRRRDETSSDDARSMSSGDQTDTNLLKCNETTSCCPPQNHSQAVEGNEKKAKAEAEPVKKRKKKAVQKKPTSFKGTRKTKRKAEAKGADMLKDLKMYADSLIHELAVAQADMVARMGDEMKKAVASGSGFDARARAKNVRHVPDKKGHISRMVRSTSENRLVSPVPGVRDRNRSCMDLNYPVLQNVVMNNSISRGFAGFQAEGFGRFSGFPVELRQGGDCSGLSYCENSIRDENGVGARIGGCVGGSSASPEGVIGGGIAKKMEVDGGFVELKDGQFYWTGLKMNSH